MSADLIWALRLHLMGQLLRNRWRKVAITPRGAVKRLKRFILYTFFKGILSLPKGFPSERTAPSLMGTQDD